jgi:hypothetical protein
MFKQSTLEYNIIIWIQLDYTILDYTQESEEDCSYITRQTAHPHPIRLLLERKLDQLREDLNTKSSANAYLNTHKNNSKGKLTGVPNPVLGSHPSVTGNPSVPHDAASPPTTSVKALWAVE